MFARLENVRAVVQEDSLQVVDALQTQAVVVDQSLSSL
jgi:hypothetical protein